LNTKLTELKRECITSGIPYNLQNLIKNSNNLAEDYDEADAKLESDEYGRSDKEELINGIIGCRISQLALEEWK